MVVSDDWVGVDGSIGTTVLEQSEGCLRVYRQDPSRIEEDARIELAQAEGGYRRTQIFELLQNATDALRQSPGRIAVLLTDSDLYVANEGLPFSESGVKTLMASYLSRKSEADIGQFGLGFKSVLAISDKPEVYSRSGSFLFDRVKAAGRIRAAGLESRRYPVLRLAEPVDPVQAADADRTLRELMSWAVTVVKLPLTCGQHERKELHESLASFPSGFMLFATHVEGLRLEDRTGGEMRTIRAQRAGEQVALLDNEARSSWIVASKTHRLSSRAIKDAGELAQRASVELTWAAPLDGGRVPLGEFWAYFPTGLRTTLSGIINAPWKLNPDRTQMLDGAYNRELLVDVLPNLVRDTLPRLTSKSDPAFVLDLLPARGKESRSFGDEILNEPVMSTLAQARSLPSRDAELARPETMRLQPRDVRESWRALWSPSRAADWAHESVDATNERRAKAERLISTGKGATASITDWIEACAAAATPEASASALRLAAQILTDEPRHQSEVRAAKVVLLEDGSMTTPVRGGVFVRNDASSCGHAFVHPGLLDRPGIQASLKLLGVEVLDPSGELRSLLQKHPRQQDWKPVWERLSEIDIEAAEQILREELPGDLTTSIFARARSGKWRPLAMLFLPGEIVPPDSREDADFVVDAHFHARHLELLERCGCVSAPRLRHERDEAWLRAFRENKAESYRNSLNGSKPGLDKIIVDGPDLPWPLESMAQLSLNGRAAITAAVLRLGAPPNWTVKHVSDRRLPRKQTKSPVVWRIHHYGVLPTTVGPAEVGICLHPDACVPPCFPVAEVSGEWANLLSLSESLDDWDAVDWSVFIADTVTRRPQRSTEVYVEAARHGQPRPGALLAQITPGTSANRKAESVAVTHDREVLRSLLLAGFPALLVGSEEDVDLLTGAWELADGRDMLKEQLLPTPDSDPVPLIDRFPPLRLYESEIPDLEHLSLQTCSSIDVLVATPQGQKERPSEQLRSGNLLLVRNGSDDTILKRVAELLQVKINIRSILDEMKRRATNAHILKIRECQSLAEKLVMAVGAEALRQHVPGPALDDLEASNGDLTPEQLAELVLAVHGYTVLQELRAELTEVGLQPPTQWVGGREARQFVTSMGFPAEYAGFPRAGLPATLTVEGQVFLPKLHTYQELVVNRIRDLMLDDRGSRRGMVTLPTGAGKTRVAVEATAHLAVEKRLKEAPVIWIGQTEELCEQAVQAWAYVWRALGRGPLEISRFWEDRHIDEAPAGTFQVVVCTIQKIQKVVDEPRYAWLVHPALIIIDEAHTSVTPSYTRVLHWLTGTQRFDLATTPLLGLTATAYRGHNETETRNLINRYGGNKLDEGVFDIEDPYQYLQKRGILAKVKQKTLEGVEITVPESERAMFEQTLRLPRQVEAQVGRDAARNGRIIQSLLQQPDDWSVLLFASSVENASALAAELCYYGVPSRPINSNTDAALRRRYIDQFKAGEIRVLTNYNVLSQGFDAPNVQAVYVTRPTFSPNLYQQMIGRGLRGPRNGGSEEVLIVNVSDNLVQYGEQLAFHHFDHLWSSHND